MLLTYFLNAFEIVPVAPVITGITVVLTFHIRCIYIARSLYFKTFSASFFKKHFCALKLQRLLTYIYYYYYYYYYYALDIGLLSPG